MGQETLSRRKFLKIGGGVAAGSFWFSARAALSPSALPVLHKPVGEIPIICPYCAVGCSAIGAVQEGKVVNIEGNPNGPINQGALCPKGTSMRGFLQSPFRNTKVLYRAPGAKDWEERDWEFALDRIARLVKDTRDRHWIAKDDDGFTVNRTEAIAGLGCATLHSEVAYALTKFFRALGCMYLEHQARICHSTTVPALGNSFGRGAMTNHSIDFKNADVVLIQGGNPAENHPLAFRWIVEAKERGAKIIVVDPTFNRSASVADLYVPIRTGTDIAFLGGLIKYILDNGLYDEYYVREYTNASFLVHPDFRTATDLDGVFSGFVPLEDNPFYRGAYDRSTWSYQLDENGMVRRDPTLEDPQTVFQLLKRQYSRYDLDTVAAVTGAPKEKILAAYELYASTGRPDRAGVITYAMGATQHTYGAQHIRGYAIVQLLLGNIGIPGGGVNAMRGHSNIQGTTDMAFLYHDLPGYLGIPTREYPTLEDWLRTRTPRAVLPGAVNWWQHYPRYFISLLRAWWPEVHPEEAYSYLPKLGPHKGGIPAKDSDYTHHAIFYGALKGAVKGLFTFGQNPAVSGGDSKAIWRGLESLEWLVVLDPMETETAAFWKRPGFDPAQNRTEVFLLPSAVWAEKEGSMTNTGRWVQWSSKLVDPPGQARDEIWFLTELLRRLRQLYREEGGAFPEPLLRLSWWDYSPKVTEEIAKEINGKDLRTGRQLSSFTELRDDGTTACGNWLYTGCFTEEGNMMARRDPRDTHPLGLGLYHNWGFAWPLNRRILYNRASVDLQGNPRNPGKWLVRWNPEAGRWEGDVPDGAAPPGTLPFIMFPEGVGRLFAAQMVDGPFPEHYEPPESPVTNRLNGQGTSPIAKLWRVEGVTSWGGPEEFPIVLTTKRLVEHFHTGMMTRNVPWLFELQPDPFVEISPELARELGIRNGQWVRLESARGATYARALVTPRMRPLVLGDRVAHQVNLVIHWGYQGKLPEALQGRVANANILTSSSHDPNTFMPGTKAALVRLAPAEIGG
ncbi:formate dehydrogenase-N subunit alpha [Thermus thermamylovorans]|uniref:Formate dehydrogenase-N subunit alpha n=1 Tax=Thermus thermamylovorans TaxID=2509362 RepID=A0A4Q9B6H7_9DEIN|nr:formate dehydrogenase-N subunit alpha [Thermus thermamylovorans]TBH21030.1 formate dehydrogenase-N subunit alpha [Thermus thermamylovorans]